MADSGMLFSIALVIITFFLYGFKWAVLISITIFLCTLFLSLSNSRGNGNAFRNKSTESGEYCDHSDIDSYFYSENPTAGMESSGTRLVRNIVRRNPTLTQDVPFNDDLQMYKSRQRRHLSSLRSPEPLLSQVTRHLSFNTTSYYYPDRTRLNLSSKSVLNPSMPPKWYNPQESTLPQPPLLDKTSSFIEERYSPRQFSIVSPSILHNTSTVKISYPGDNDSRFALESILHKRLERTKDNPCSRQSVLSALGQKSRKRSAYDSDSSMVESYSVKKRRRDDLDDFLDAVNNPLSAPYTGVKSIKRPYSDSISEKPTLEITTKRSKENETGPDSESSPPLRNFTSSAFEDSGVDVNSPTKILQEIVLTQAKVVQPAQLRKRKSVTFSDKLVNGPGGSSEKEELTPEDGNIQDANHLKKDSQEDCSQIFRIGFSPRKSLAPEYLSSISNRTESKKSPRHRRGSNITWKDLQENRREAWRRSQKLLDEIEESFSKEIGPTSSLVVTTISTTTVTSPVRSTITSLPTSTVSSTSQQSTTDQVQTQNTTVASPLTNFISNGTEQARHMRATSMIGSNTLFGGISSGSSGTTGDLTFAVPKSSSKSSSITGLFGGTSNAGAVSLSAPSLSSSNTSSKANATSQQSFSFQASVTSAITASQPTTSTLSTFSFQPSTVGALTGNITQTTAPVTQNTTAGIFSTGSGSIVRSNIQTPNVTTTTSSVTQPKAGGFSFSSSPVTKATPTSDFSFNAPAVMAPSVSGGFTFTTQAGEKTTSQKSITFTAPTTAAPTTEKPSTSGGFTFTAPMTEKPSTNSSFTFTAPSSNKQNTSGGFAFTAPATDKASGSGGFQFNAPAVNNNSSTFSFTASTAKNANPSGGFTFNAGAGNKPSNSAGFNFESQKTAATFNFGSPAPAGGFNFAGGFAASTPIPTNSGRPNNALAKTKQRRRQKRQ